MRIIKIIALLTFSQMFCMPTSFFAYKPSKAAIASFGIGAIFSATFFYGIQKFFTPQKLSISEDIINTFTLTPTEYCNSPIPKWDIKKTIESIKYNFTPEKLYIPIFDKKTEKETATLFLQKNVAIPKNTPRISLYCRGYARRNLFFLPKYLQVVRTGGGLLSGYTYLSNNFLHGTTVVFDSISHRQLFNFGQNLDQKCLSFIHEKIIQQAPNTPITLSGTCLGAYNVLKFAQTNPKNVDTLVLFSPIFSAKRTVRQLSNWYITQKIGIDLSSSMYTLFQYWFPNFDKNKDTLEDELENIKNYTIFIAHYEYDKFISNKDIVILIEKLKKHNHVYFVSTSDLDAKHANFFNVSQVKKEINMFYEYLQVKKEYNKNNTHFPIIHRYQNNYLI